MRNNANFNPNQYAEEPQDGRSHIRSQLLSDFFSLLNHDVVGVDEPSPNAQKFIKERNFEELSTGEAEELDELAGLPSGEHTVDKLIEFYRKSAKLRIKDAEEDPFSFVFAKQSP